MALRIAVLNDYPIDEALLLASRGEYPAHHTWGTSLFEQFGALAVIARFPGAGLWSSLRRQLFVLRHQRRFDVVYAACQSETWLLSRLRYMGLFGKPIVAVIHHPMKGRLRGGRSYVLGHDRLLFLSKRVSQEAAEELPVCASRCEAIAWGVDMAFYERQQRWEHGYGMGYFVSAGKANRDHQTLADAAAQAKQRTLIVCSSDTMPAQSDPEWVAVRGVVSGQTLTYGQLTSVYRTARAVVIPLLEVTGLAGLTSLLDAMACGLPVIMTRNALIDIDIEALGFGIWVPPGDVDALRKAMTRLAQDDELVRAMGEKARAYAERSYGYQAFAQRIVSTCAAVVRTKPN